MRGCRAYSPETRLEISSKTSDFFIKEGLGLTWYPKIVKKCPVGPTGRKNLSSW